MACIPKLEGGLGVLNLRVQNESLLLKHLHKFYNRVDVPWVHLVWAISTIQATDYLSLTVD